MLLGKRRRASRSSAEHPSMNTGVSSRALWAQSCGTKAWRELSPGRLALGRALLEMQKAQQSHASPGYPVLLGLLVRRSFGGVAGGVPRSVWLIWSIPCPSSGPDLVTLSLLAEPGVTYLGVLPGKHRLLWGSGLLQKVEGWLGSDSI